MIGKKASVKVIKKAEELSGRSLSKLTSWEQAFDILMSGYLYDVHTRCAKDGDSTLIRLLKEDSGAVVDSFIIPNDMVYDTSKADWDWNLIYKTICEYLTKKRHSRTKKLKNVNKNELRKEIANLAVLIKTSIGADKRRYVKEYNEKSKLLESIPDAPKKVEQKIDVAALRKRRGNLCTLIYNYKKKGKDYSALQTELDSIKAQLARAKK